MHSSRGYMQSHSVLQQMARHSQARRLEMCDTEKKPGSTLMTLSSRGDIDDLAQDCSNSSALAMELLQSCTT